MKLSRASRRALAVLAHLALDDAGGPTSATEMAAAGARVSRGLIARLMAALVRAGLLRSAEGARGGSWLARPAEGISLLAVVEAVDGPVRGDAGTVGQGEVADLDRRLQEVCDGAAALVRERLAMVTLAELARGK